MTKNFILILVLFLVAIPQIHAMRCGTNLIFEGDSSFDVLSKCGEPLDKQVYEESVPIYNEDGAQVGVTNNVVEKWIYQKSPADFQYELIFDEGVVKQINANRNPT